MFDVDNDKTISVKELSTIMRSLGQNPTEEEVSQMMKDADEDDSGDDGDLFIRRMFFYENTCLYSSK